MRSAKHNAAVLRQHVMPPAGRGMLDSRRMEAFKLRFPNHGHAELPLGTGVHGIGHKRRGDDSGQQDLAFELVDDAQSPLLRFCVDRRGVWMTVSDDARGVHVNGRPVRRMAMLRLGDAVFADGVEMVLVAGRGVDPIPQALHGAPADGIGDPRVVLRGVGGQHHGRSFTLEQPRTIGRAHDVDIRIDDPAFAERHARIELHDGQIILRDLGSAEGSVVNGEQIRDALLHSGDQIVVDGQHRFVLEAPARAVLQRDVLPTADPEPQDGTAIDTAAAWNHSARRLPWLLLAALLLAAALAALLLFGAGAG